MAVSYTENAYNYPGAFRIKVLDIENADKTERSSLISVVNRIVLEESIFSASVYGYLDITDSVGLQLELPIVGAEKIYLEYTTDESSGEFPVNSLVFRVYKLSDRVSNTQTNLTYRLHFVSEEFHENQKNRISKAYKGKTVTEIAEDLLRNTIRTTKQLDLVQTINPQQLVIPRLNAFEAISWLTNLAIDPSYEGSLMMFWETKFGYRLRSLESLYELEPVAEYSRVIKLDGSVSEESRDNGIDSYSFTQCFDSLGSLDAGLLGSTLYTLDPLTRSFKTFEYSYKTQFEKQKHLEFGTVDQIGLQYANQDESKNSCIKFLFSESSQVESDYIKSKSQDTQVFPKKREDSLQSRISQLSQLNQSRIQFQVPGDSRLEAGDIIVLNLPSYGTISSGVSARDPYLSGRYLATKVIHQIEGSNYTTRVFANRDTYKTKPLNRNILSPDA